MASDSPSRRAAGALLALLLGLAGLAPAAGAEVLMGRREAVAQAFPDADHVESRSLVLDEDQKRAIEALARSPLESRLVTVYTGMRGGQVLGYAFIETHVVRTQPEAFLVVLGPDGALRSLRLLAFYEPSEYRPPDRWLHQFDARHLSPELRLGGAIHGIAGATLSSQAVTGGVRRSLALYEVLLRGPAAPPRDVGAASPATATATAATAAGGR